MDIKVIADYISLLGTCCGLFSRDLKFTKHIKQDQQKIYLQKQ